MSECHRWDPCIAHRGDEAARFIQDYFSQPDRRVLLVAGAGFDPRSLAVTDLLCSVAQVRAFFVKENRPDSPRDQLSRADANTRELQAEVDDNRVLKIAMWAEDGAVVGGRNLVQTLNDQDYNGITDIVVDVSALSVGTSFPAVRYFVERIDSRLESANLHVFVAHDPELDEVIHPIPSDTPSYVHGFKGGSTLSEAYEAARLWLPQLAFGRHGVLRQLYDFVNPHDTCPILPFPASDPRRGDRLVEEYTIELEVNWTVDARDLVYADEADPLDLYRTILKLDDVRRPVFSETGGSKMILSPISNKVMALGALMAAIERNLPVAYLEPVGYKLAEPFPKGLDRQNIIHVWLEGTAYTQPRPALSR